MPRQIAEDAKTLADGRVRYDFGRSYDFKPIAWVHGSAVVSGNFVGHAVRVEGLVRIKGNCFFDFSDVFTDPTDVMRQFVTDNPEKLPVAIRSFTDLFGRAFRIDGSWYTRLEAAVLMHSP